MPGKMLTITDNKQRYAINILIMILVLIGLYLSFTAKDGETLAARGIRSLKYFTVDSNILVGVVSAIFLITTRNNSQVREISIMKLVSAASVGITFLTVVAFLGPLYGYSRMYHRANFLFHLVVPLMSMFEFILFNRGKLKKTECILCALPVLIYGAVYMINLFVNGIEKGDWYGFVNWGFAAGIGIFCVICLISIILGLLLRIINDRVLEGYEEKPFL